MRYFESPTSYLVDYTKNETSIFLAGGIQNCTQWQTEMVDLLSSTDLAVLNPRRKDFPIHDPSAAEAQITWEHEHLWMADLILFWFPSETLCPIVLFELGFWLSKHKKLFIGVDPAYQRRQDVEIQTRLARERKYGRSDIQIVYSISDLAKQVTDYAWISICSY